jgi:hypothetical protein
LNDVGYNYLKSRGLNDEQIERYNFASYKMYGIDTIFIPNSITDNKTNFYQLRYTSGSFRYLNCHTNSKPLFGRQSVLGRRKLGLCEGIFTSIGFERLNIDTVTLLGKFLTDSQKDELLKLVNDNKYEEVIVALDKDTMRESTELSKYLLDNLTCNISVIINKDENDYADQTIEELKKNYDKRIKITSSSLGLLPYLSSL